MAVLVVWWLGLATTSPAQQPPVHYYHQGIMPPGAIGGRQLQRGGPLPGFFQPVEIKAPPGASISLAVENQFDHSRPAPCKVGLLIGAVYRLRVTNIPLAEGMEVFPTIEVIDRLYAPPDQQRRFAIPIEITADDLRLALDGKFVTRVIYLEDPRNALPARENAPTQNWFEATPGQDPLALADGLGRPVAILRLGARQPDASDMVEPMFYYNSPPWMAMPATPETIAKPAPNKSPLSLGEAQGVRADLADKTHDRSSTAASDEPKVLNLPPPPGAEERGETREETKANGSEGKR